MSDIAIRVENLSKLYHIGRAQQRHDTLRDALVDALPRISRIARRKNSDNSCNSWQKENDDTIWALKDVSFEVQRGEVVGIIGRNGAGKSTLLKILSRITEPTTGRAEIHGRVGSLLEVGTGFHPELTGRENIYLNGAILGMRRVEIDKKFDEIVAFAEIEKFLDTPVKRYSSGMYVRLAFAVAAHLEPEILLVDEVLAVGDAAFQNKCLGKMGDVACEGRTVLFVSHNMAAVATLCRTAIVMQGGILTYTGEVSTAVRSYLEICSQRENLSLEFRKDRSGNGLVQLVECKICSNPQDEPVSEFILGDNTCVVLTLFSQAQVKVWPGVDVVDAFGRLVFSFNGRERGFVPLIEEGTSKLILTIPFLPLLEGKYSLNFVCVLAAQRPEVCDRIERIGSFAVYPKDIFSSGSPYKAMHGLVFIDYKWAGPVTEEANVY